MYSNVSESSGTQKRCDTGKCGDEGYPESQSIPEQCKKEAEAPPVPQVLLESDKSFFQESSVPLKLIYSLVYLLDMFMLPCPANKISISWDFFFSYMVFSQL